MKFLLLFAVLTIAIFGFRNLMTKKERRFALRSAASWLVPAGVALCITSSLLFFSLHFNGKVI